MSTDRNREQQAGEEAEQRPTKRKDAGAGNASVGAIDGIGGAGGSSGTGSVRSKVRAVGDISGIETDADIPAPGSIGKGKGGSRDRQISDDKLRGKTRGEDSKTVPNQSGPNQQGAGNADASDR